MELNLLIADDMHPLLMQQLDEKKISYRYFPDSTPEEIKKILSRYNGLVVRSKIYVDKQLLDDVPGLLLIARAGSGMDNIDEAYARQLGVELINVPEANADSVGEHTVGMLLAVMLNLVKADKEVRNMEWNREANRGIELKGKTVGLVGYGFTGKAVAKKLSGFEVTVLAYDKYLKNYGDNYATQASMTDIFERADILSLHIPLTDETHHLVNADYINKFKKKVILLNLSRGKVVNQQHLVKALAEGKIKACALDVLENEKLEQLSKEEKEIFTELAGNNKVVFAPHIGGWTHESYEKISFFLSNKISYLANQFAETDWKRQSKT